MKTASRFALVAAAGLLLGAAMTPAQAADLKSGCCADLEERVAELEATTARKGNRVVSLQLYGQVNKALMIWDDGVDSDAFVVDNTLASSRFGIAGSAKIKPGLTAGYNMEFELVDARADMVYADKNGDDPASGFNLRQNYWYLESDRLGRLSVGRQSAAADGASEVVLSNSMRNADSNLGANFCIRTSIDSSACGATLNSTLQPPAQQWAADFTADRIASLIRYDSPSFYGFILSASAGDNDYADIALRFKKEFSTVRLAAAISYLWDDAGAWGENNVLAGSISAMHVPTGLYAAFAAGQRDFDNPDYEDESFWYVQAGIEKKWLAYGATTFYGEYGQYSGFYQPGASGVMNDSEATRVGFGVNQKIDAAAMDIYAHATFWSFDDKASDAGHFEYEDLTTVVIGSRIQF